MQDMRDFRDAKAMAHALRAALAAKGHKITSSESLELIARAFGVVDWNTLSATIRREAAAPRNNTPPPQVPSAESAPTLSALPPQFLAAEIGRSFSAALSSTLHRAIAYADQRKHQYATLEHLLLALIADEDASPVMEACKIDIDAVKENLTSYIDNGLKELVIGDGNKPKLTAGFQRVAQRAALYAQWRGLPTLTGAEFLVAIFAERESLAARLLGEQEMSRQDALNFVIHGIAKGGGNTAG
jgi:Glyoxalase superfamily protein/Clp amino terminal domain, pathogenicity island component